MSESASAASTARSSDDGYQLSIGQCATLACLLEVTAPKPGNVHRGADHEHTTLTDYVVSATAIGPAMEQASQRPLGETISAAIAATRQLVPSSRNTGKVLLIAPLASVRRETPLDQGAIEVLQSIPEDDTEALSAAWGDLLVDQPRDDLPAPSSDFGTWLRSIASQDQIASQYVNGFQQIMQFAVPRLCKGDLLGWPLSDTIVHTHVQLLAQYSDSVIARCSGIEAARRAALLAATVLAAGEPGEENYHRALADLDFWLRSDGERRNPAATADLISAALFVVLRDGLIRPPFR